MEREHDRDMSPEEMESRFGMEGRLNAEIADLKAKLEEQEILLRAYREYDVVLNNAAEHRAQRIERQWTVEVEISLGG
jgi:hypothetical protein